MWKGFIGGTLLASYGTIMPDVLCKKNLNSVQGWRDIIGSLHMEGACIEQAGVQDLKRQPFFSKTSFKQG